MSVEGQIEGGVVMSMGFALTERYPLTDCRPTAKYGTLGLFRANQIPEITPIIVERAGLNVPAAPSVSARSPPSPQPQPLQTLLPLRRQVPYQSAPGGHTLQP